MSKTLTKSSNNLETFGGRLEKALEEAGVNQSELARRAGTTKKTIQRYLSREDAPDTKRRDVRKIVDSIATVLSVRQEWLEKGEGPMLQPSQDNGEEDTAEKPRYVEAKGIIVCAGDGAEPEQYSKHIVPAEQYARDHATSIPANGKGDKWYVKVVGDSMAPEFFEDQWLPVELVQKPLTQVRRSGLYVVYWMDFLQLRRVARKADGSFVLLCTNPAYPNEVLEPKQAKEAIACAKVRLRERDQLIGSLMRRIVGEK